MWVPITRQQPVCLSTHNTSVQAAGGDVQTCSVCVEVIGRLGASCKVSEKMVVSISMPWRHMRVTVMPKQPICLNTGRCGKTRHSCLHLLNAAARNARMATQGENMSWLTARLP